MRKLLCWLLMMALVSTMPMMAMAESMQVEDEMEPADFGWDYPVSAGDIDDRYLMLANESNPLTKEDEPTDLITLRSRRNDEAGNNENAGIYMASSGSVQLRRAAATALSVMVGAAEAEQLTLYVRAGYRSYEDQQKRYDRAVKQGKTDEVQPAGACDYQTGLAVTLVNHAYRGKTLDAAYGSTAEGKWIAANAARFGFILRYPQGKESITGYDYEPWHLRYVGTGVAAYITQNNLTLEEFVAEKNAYIAEFTANGGDMAALLEGLILPEGPVTLSETGPDGDHEIVLFHD